MSKISRTALLCLLALLTLFATNCVSQPQPIEQNLEDENSPTESTNASATTPLPQEGEPEEASPVEGWAVLAEKDDFTDVEMTNMPVDYIDNQRLFETLMDAGWEADHIHDLREFDRASLEEELDWLENNADENDIVFVFVASHGNHLTYHILWEEFFKEEWAQIPSQRRILLLDTCQAGKFTDVVLGDARAQLAIASVDEDEFAWKGLEEEGLPIIGGVFTYYFNEAFSNLEADADANGLVSIQEASLYAEEFQQKYMHEVVWAVPEFIEPYHQMGLHPEDDPLYPDVILTDTIAEPLYFELSYY